MAGKKSTGGLPKDGRTRNWTFLVYPESAPENWRDILDEFHIEWVESPLHNQDVNPGTGELKKEHWHVLVMFEGKKSHEQVAELIKPLKGPSPQMVPSVKGLVRYMAHLDNPEKAQYNKSEIIGHGGADVMELLKPSSASRYELLREMMNYIRENHITETADFVYMAADERPDDWFPLLADNSLYLIDTVIRSERNRSKPEK